MFFWIRTLFAVIMYNSCCGILYKQLSLYTLLWPQSKANSAVNSKNLTQDTNFDFGCTPFSSHYLTHVLLLHLCVQQFQEMKLFTVLCSSIVLLGLYTPKSLSDSPPLLDVCPMAPQSERKLFMNGFLCKNPSTIMASDFKTLLLNHAGDLDNMVRSSVNIVTAAEFPGLNTLGLSMARTDIAPSGAVLPHSHPRASEMMFVHGGSVVVGFFDTKGRLFQKTLGEGDVFIFPRGLVHYTMNYGIGLATTFSVLNSQNPGVVGITHAMFAPDSDVVEGLMARMMRSRKMGMSGNNTVNSPWSY